MKGNIKFILFIVLLLIIAVAIEMSLPRKFSWEPTFSQYDKEPFGSFIFDDVLRSSLKNGYSLSDKTFYQLANDSTEELRSILSFAENQRLSKIDVNAILKMVNEGNKIMLGSSYLSYLLSDTLAIEHESSYFNIRYLKRYATLNVVSRDTLTLQDSAFKKRIYSFYTQINTGYFYRNATKFRKSIPEDLPLRAQIKVEPRYPRMKEAKEDTDSVVITLAGKDETVEVDSTVRVKTAVHRILKDTIPVWADSLVIRPLACDTAGYPVALEISLGEGKLYLIANPLIFTNYGMLDHDNAGYIFSLLSYIDDLPVTRTESYVQSRHSQEADTPLRYFLSEKALRWSLYLLLAGILLFMIFTAKRKQRIIPVIEPPVNKTVEFTELIGTLYFQRKDYTDLTLKKYIYFAEQLKRNTYIDIEAEEITSDLCIRLSNKTGIDAEKLNRLLSELHQLKQGGEVGEEQMKDYINRMNEVLNNSR